MSDQFDIIIVGGGPGGYVTAIRARQLGFKTALVEREHLGGICLNWGCIPTKALLRSSEIFYTMQHLKDYGLKADNLSFDIEAVVKRSRNVAGQLNAGVKGLMKKNKVTVYDGSARLTAKGKLTVEKDGKPVADLAAQHIILATGARAREIPGMEADGELIWTYKHAMTPKKMPKSLLVMGSGAIGIEFASFYRSMGAEVTVVEMMPRILPVEDEEISGLARKAFEKQGMKIITGAQVKELKKGKGQVTASIETGKGTETITVETVISAIGIVGNVENIGLEDLGIKVDRTHIVVDEWSRTNVEGIYAIGDVAGPPWLAHKASHEGVLCVEKIAGRNNLHPLDVSRIPGCTYSHPQVASIGLTEAKAKEQGYKIKVGRFPFIGNGKAIALGDPNGLIKTIFDEKTGELLGAHMIGPEVTELIQGYTIARTLEATEADLMETVFPHPTISEAMHEAVLDAYGQVIHI